MATALENVAGVIIEDKGLSLSVHYRLVSPEEEDTVAEVFRRLTRPLLEDDREIKSALNLEPILTIYLGDDTTDEDAFKALHLPDGWSIFVGRENPLSAAGHYLESVSEVEEFLTRLIELK